jgi:hypothetical protein
MPLAARPLRGGIALLALLVAGLVVGCDGTSAPRDGSPTSTGPPSTAHAATAPARQPHTLVLAATGTAKINTLSYVIDGRTAQVKSVTLPWRKPVDVPADGRRHEWSLSVQHGSGHVDLVAIFDGTVVARGTGSTTGTGSANVGGSVLG